ncbi:MAG: MgtC/SapB family protein [Clostridiaceae bacterium]|mgnify:CR=1 FL=1|nr:MgtC/SapB family protein [Clostridiaceae bacterium]
MHFDYINTLEMLRDINIISLLFRVILAMLSGGLIGFERGLKNRSAGFRTNILVCLGSTIVMCTSQYIHQYLGGIDLTRMGAQVISGIGFLGAGTIIVKKDRTVKGLTTAAGLWAVACIGLAIGIGFYSGAIIGTLSIFLTNTVLRLVDEKFIDRGNVVDYYVEFTDATHIPEFVLFVTEKNLKIINLSVIEGRTAEQKAAITISLDNSSRISQEKIFQTLNEANEVVYLEEI